MKKTLISLALFALCASAQAQFTFQKADGKTISSTKAPDCKWKLVSTPTELYFTWEKDRVRVYEIGYENVGSGIYRVDEYYIYYLNFDLKKLIGGYSNFHKSYYQTIRLKDDKKIPYHKYYKDRSSGGMKNETDIFFPSKAEADDFVRKVTEKGLDLALDLNYEAPPQLVLEKYEYPNSSPAPAKRTDARITLANDSTTEIRLSYQDSPSASSSRTITIAPRSTYFLTGAIGGQVYWMKLKSSGLYGKDKLAIQIVESMDETKIVLAK